MDESHFIAAILENRFNRAILDGLPALGLPDAWIVSGALFQTVWNLKTGHAPEHGIRDYDIFYFDPDVSWEAEDRAIQKAAAHFPGVLVELRNQARVHLWYEEKFHMPYPPLTRATDGIDRFLMHNAQVGIRRNAAGYEVYAPRGFGDIDAMIIRPNITANFHPDRYREKALRWKEHWPGITILPAPTEDLP
ncbi:MAG TPA: nucleotidyltransferase family protein [Rhizomicrobium sp.]|jgi:hypothetical protein